MKRFLKGVYILITVGTLAVYIVAALSPYLNPNSFWPMTFLSLGFPLIAIGTFLVIFFWLLIHKKTGLILLVMFVVTGFTNLTSTFGFHYFSSFDNAKSQGSLRLMTWNVRYFDNAAKHADSANSIRRRMINYVKEVNADILVCQDFREIISPAVYSNIQVLRDTLGYKYCYFSKDTFEQFSYGVAESGVIIFSKLPFADTGKVSYADLRINESLAYADIVFLNKRFRLFTTHLLSMNLYNGEEIKEEGKYLNYNQVEEGTSKIKPIKHYDRIHALQAEKIRGIINKSPYPVIVTGDFNSVPSSYVYHTIKGNLLDPFIKKGRGFSSSYKALSPTLRIDYILHDPSFKTIQFKTPKLYLSDHFPVVADLTWKDKR